jgi:hypothetical protein
MKGNMPRRDGRDDYGASTVRPSKFEKSELEKDILRAVLSLLANCEFTGHDDRRFIISTAAPQESQSEIFIEVRLKLDGDGPVVAKYAIMLQQISD